MNAMEILSEVIQVLVQAIGIYSFVLIVRILLTWFPNVDWSNPILSSISSITDPYLNIFRGLIPPIGGIDLSAILAIFALQIMQGLLTNTSQLAFKAGMSYYS